MITERAHDQPVEGPTNPAEQVDEILQPLIAEARTTACLTSPNLSIENYRMVFKE